jgi:hypothetical protein
MNSSITVICLLSWDRINNALRTISETSDLPLRRFNHTFGDFLDPIVYLHQLRIRAQMPNSQFAVIAQIHAV